LRLPKGTQADTGVYREIQKERDAGADTADRGNKGYRRIRLDTEGYSWDTERHIYL